MRFKVTNSTLATPTTPVQLNNTSAINFRKKLRPFHVLRDLLGKLILKAVEIFSTSSARPLENSSISIMRWVAVRFSKLS